MTLVVFISSPEVVMAEAVGLIAAVFQLVNVISKGCRFAKDVYKAPSDIERLLSRLQQLRRVVDQISDLPAESNSCFEEVISQAQESLRKLDKLISTKIVFQKDGVLQVRYLAWIKYRRKVKELLKAFAESQNLLALTITANTLKVVTRTGVTLAPRPSSSGSIKPCNDASASSSETLTTAATTTSKASVIWSQISQLSLTTSNPVGSFEAGHSYRPEQYTASALGLQLVCYSLDTTQISLCAVIQMCELFCQRSDGQWMHFRMKLTVTAGSAYWDVARTHETRAKGFQDYVRLPEPLVKLLQSHISTGPALLNREIKVLWDQSQVSEAKEDLSHAASKISVNPISNHALEIAESIRHQNIPTYLDSELVTVHLYGLYFATHVGNRWVRYQAATPDSLQKLWHHLQVLVALRREPHVGQLVGIVINRDTRAFKGVLSEFPEAGPLRDLLTEHRRSTRPVPWSRREKWAKQIVRGVVSFHSRNLTIGCLGRTHGAAIAIDGNDDAVIHRFSPLTSWNAYDKAGKLPPEHRPHSCQPGQTKLTPQFDIFQLGLLLWHLYRNEEHELGGAFCQIAGCDRASSGDCNEPHADPVALPTASDDVPDYLAAIISQCRAEDPRDRPAAWELLPLFPNTERSKDVASPAADEDRPIGMKGPFRRLEDVRRIYHRSMFCDICGGTCLSIYYKCDNCRQGDFTVCEGCFNLGRHCSASQHLLARYDADDRTNEASGVGIQYFTDVGAEGERQIKII